MIVGYFVVIGPLRQLSMHNMILQRCKCCAYAIIAVLNTYDVVRTSSLMVFLQ